MSEIVIVGNGPASVGAVEAIRGRDRDVPIKIITKEHPLPYARLALADMVEGELDRKDIALRSEDFFSEYNVDVVSQTEVISVDPSFQSLKVRKDEERKQEFDFSKLLISTGASPVIPPIDGVESEGVCTLGSTSDVKKIHRQLEEREMENCVVVGAGFIGLEAAEALKELGLQVHLVEIFDRILPNLLDKSAADTFENKLEESDIKIHLKTKIHKINGDPVESAVAVDQENSTREEIGCDLIILAAGMNPNVDLIENTGVKTNDGIIVNKQMETSAEGVYSAGDVAEAYNVFGERCTNMTWISATFQGKAAGTNMVGEKMEYLDLRQNIIDVFDTKIVSIGRTPNDAGSPGLEVIRKTMGGKTRIGIFDSDRLVGFTSLGSEDAVEDAGPAAALIRKKFEMKKKEKIWTPGFCGKKLIDDLGLHPNQNFSF